MKDRFGRQKSATSTRKHSFKPSNNAAMSSWCSPVAQKRAMTVTITPAKQEANNLSLRTNPPATQSYIDVGQCDFGTHVTCRACGLWYTAGEVEDEKEHEKLCKQMKRGVSFANWKTERMVKTFADTRARIVEIRHDDPRSHINKLLEIKTVLDDALGFVLDDVFLQRSHFVYIQDQQVVGYVNTERINKAFTLDKSVSNMVKIGMDSSIAANGAVTASATSHVALVGICLIWVHPSFRKRTIATRLVDIVREKSIYGMRVAKNVVAFAQPTRMGLQFAQKYVRPYDVLVY